MKQLVEVKLEDGGTILVEAEQPEVLVCITRASCEPGDIYFEATQTFEQGMEKIQAATEKTVQKLYRLSRRPVKLKMKSGFNCSAQFGAVIASAIAEANYRVTLRWTRQEGE